MVFDAHTEGIDENGTEQGLLEPLILYESLDTGLEAQVTELDGLPAAVFGPLLLDFDLIGQIDIAELLVFVLIIIIQLRRTATRLAVSISVISVTFIFSIDSDGQFRVGFSAVPVFAFPVFAVVDAEISASFWVKVKVHAD